MPLTVMKGAPLTSLFRFFLPPFSSGNVHILSVRGRLYVVSVRPLDKTFFLGSNCRSKVILPLKTKRLNMEKTLFRSVR